MARPVGLPRVSQDGGREAGPASREPGRLASVNACQWDARPSKEAIPMPETKAQRSEAARKGAAAHKARELEEEHERERKRQEQIDRTSELSDEVLKSLESGSRVAIEAVRKFVDVVDEAL